MRPDLLLMLLTSCSTSYESGTGRSRPVPEPASSTAIPPSLSPRVGPVVDADSGTPDACEAVNPRAPAPPDTIGTLTVTVSTSAGENDGTHDDTLELCLTADRCFPLAQTGAPQLGDGATGVWMFEGVALPRAEVDRVTLRVTDGGDRWQPHRLDLRFDGEPVYCADLDVAFGTGRDEVSTWTDPAALHRDCVNAWDDRALTHGPMVGAVGPERANVWVRTDATRPVSVQIWPSGDPASAWTAAWAYPRAEDDFTATLQIDCLAPSTSYTYEVRVDGAAQGSPATFTTAPPVGQPSTWRMAFGSCVKDRTGQPVFSAIAREPVDWFAFVGDNHYGNSTNLDALRWFYRKTLESADRAAFVAATPTFAVWDDHDFAGNDVDGNVEGKERSLRAFTEYWANPAYGLPGTPGVFFARPWGDVDLVFLDARYWRGVHGTMLGAVQYDWLVEKLTTSTATFKLIIDGSQWTFETGNDSWGDYPADRDELFDLIAEQGISGVVLLSGDIHRVELRELPNAAYPIPEISSSPLAQTSPRGCERDDPDLLACFGESNHYVTLDVDTTAADPRLTATVHLEDGTEVHAHTWTLSDLTP